MQQTSKDTSARASISQSRESLGARLSHWRDYARDGLEAVKNDISELRKLARDIGSRSSIRSFLKRAGIGDPDDTLTNPAPVIETTGAVSAEAVPAEPETGSGKDAVTPPQGVEPARERNNAEQVQR